MTTFFTRISAYLALVPILLIDHPVHEITVDSGTSMSEIFQCSSVEPVKKKPIKRFSQEKQIYLGAADKNQKKFDISPDTLLEDERAIYDRLGPIYQKIYLYAFNNEERQRVVVYVSRGLDPLEAINTILRVEERKYKRSLPPQRSLTPAERSATRHLPRQQVF